MKKVLYAFFIILCFSSFSFAADTVILNGKNITYKEIVQIADGAKVEIDKDALARVVKSHQTLVAAAESGQQIYGLTVGVGLNKDRKFVNAAGKLTDDVINASKIFNRGLIHAHCGGTGKLLDVRTARAIMATRLNNMLAGGSGVQKEVVLMIKDLLNNQITPMIPGTGSIGEADITIMGHLGLAIVGEGNVTYNGKVVAAKNALKKVGLKPVVLFGKDSLSIISSNSYSGAMTALLMNDMDQLIKVSKLVFATSLEGLNGNIAPFSAEAVKLRPYPYFDSAAKDIRDILKGSYLWNRDDTRALQDPLSFRDAVHYIAVLEESFDQLKGLMQIQYNSSDDNPGVLIDAGVIPSSDQEAKMFVPSGGAVVPTSNFEIINWVLALEKLSLALGVNSTVATQRTIKLDNDYFTKLSRFLGTKETVHAFGAMQKPIAALNAENLFLSNPAVTFNVPVAGDIEDIATNAPFIAQKVQKQINNLFQIYAIELVHAAQALDLRKQKSHDTFIMASVTQKFYDAFREKVKFMQKDKPLSGDFASAYKFLKTY